MFFIARAWKIRKNIAQNQKIQYNVYRWKKFHTIKRDTQNFSVLSVVSNVWVKENAVDLVKRFLF